jgi:twinkle protein
MFNKQYDVVSLRSGASNAAKEIKEQLEWLESYENIVICFDNDKAGDSALEQVKDLFSPNKLRICKLPVKDASDMLMANRVKDFTQAWWNAKVYRPDGIVAGTETWDTLVEKRQVKSIPYPWEGLNHITRGHRPYELVTITSGSGMGKSQFIREIEYDLLRRCEGNIGVLALEEDLARTSLGIMSVAANRPLHLEEDTPVDQLRPFWEATLGTGRYYLFDHWGSTSADNLLARVRYMAKALDCRYVVLDHLSIVVSSQESGDERKAIDEIMTKLRTLVAETGIGLFLVSHLRRSQGKAHEDGAQISLGELRGSQAIAQLSDIVIGMERDQQNANEDIRNTTTVRVLKNRYTGETGPACYLQYDRSTGRMTEVANPEVGADF